MVKPSPSIPIYQVLLEEYEQQKTRPRLPPDFFSEAKKKHEPALQGIQDQKEHKARLEAALTGEFYSWLHGQDVKRSALCLSGGGIRSATFALGVVQGLAERGLLQSFDYLSTVSGGGYLGGWLSAWIHRAGGIAAVEGELKRRPSSPFETEPEPLRHLRQYSRYLSPKAGFLSADTWTLVGTYLRNLLLNWLVFVPLLAVMLLVPRLSTALLMLQPGTAMAYVPAGIALILGWISIAVMAASRPSLCRTEKPGAKPASRLPKRFREQSWFLVLCLFPLWLSGVSATLAWAWMFGSPPLSRVVTCVLFGTALSGGGFLLSRLVVRRWALAEAALTTAAGALGGLLAYIASVNWPGLCNLMGVEAYATLATPTFLFMFLIAATIFVGLASFSMDDGDREWMARAGSWILILIVVRAGISAIVLFGPVAFANLGYLLSSAGGISGLITLVLGSGAKSGSTPGATTKSTHAPSLSERLTSFALAAAAPVFIGALLVGLSLATSALLKWLLLRSWPIWMVASLGKWQHWNSWVCQAPPPLEGIPLSQVAYYTPLALLLLLALALLAVAGVMGFFIDINRFSMHALYRDRLIRAYLGASRDKESRKPNPFSGFDPADNLAMSSLGVRPLHLVNLTLNLVSGKNLAWQDRKAEPFSVTSLHSGNYRLGYRSSAAYGYDKGSRSGISLGTAVAVSGAAASPNMGYHSSPVVTFLLTLFNVRLGWWLGNPAAPEGDRTFDQPGPKPAWRPLLSEAFGLTDDTSRHVYLSDGGHFENLGLYEMVLRRCRSIIVSDGSEDAEFDFESLGGALSKIRIDLGIPIIFTKVLMTPRPADARIFDPTGEAKATPYFALGRICYSCVDRPRSAGGKVPDGYLILIKSSLNGTEPLDIYQYWKAHPAFPHESTANQFFSEAQFESYRALGERAVANVCAAAGPCNTLDELFDAFRESFPASPAGR